MLLVVAVLIGVITVPLGRGRVSRLGTVRLRWAPAIFASIALQILIISVIPDGSPLVHRLLHLFSYVLAAAFLIANRQVAGMWVIAFGASLNLVAILANNGVMPASAHAQRVAGLVTPTRGFINSAAVAHPRLLFLGDIFPIPRAIPLHNVYSVGDICIAIGAIVAVHALSRSRLVSRAKPPVEAIVANNAP